MRHTLGFSVTYEIVTPESAERGDIAESGFLAQHVSFREALQVFNDERDWSTIEADEHPLRAPRWFTDHGAPAWASGDVRSVSLHLPARITAGSRMRIARLVGCYGAAPRQRSESLAPVTSEIANKES